MKIEFEENRDHAPVSWGGGEERVIQVPVALDKCLTYLSCQFWPVYTEQKMKTISSPFWYDTLLNCVDFNNIFYVILWIFYINKINVQNKTVVII